MFDEISFPQGFNATSEIVEFTQPPEVRKLLVAEIAQMKDEAKLMDYLNPSRNEKFPAKFPVYGFLSGLLDGAVIAVIAAGTGGNIALGAAEGMVIGLSAGSATEAIVERATSKINDLRQQNFSKRVWSALPPEKQQTIKALFPQVKK